MPDITMCMGFKPSGDMCKIRDKCYRFTATPDHFQSFFQEAPFKGGSVRKPYRYCEEFWGYDNFGRSTCKR